MDNALSEDAIKTEIEIMEKEYIYLSGKNRARAKRRYLRLLKSCGKTCGISEPIFIDRI